MDVRGYSHQRRLFPYKNQASPTSHNVVKISIKDLYTEPAAPSEIALDSSMEDIPSMVEFEEAAAASSESVFSDQSHSDWESHTSDDEADISLSA